MHDSVYRMMVRISMHLLGDLWGTLHQKIRKKPHRSLHQEQLDGDTRPPGKEAARSGLIPLVLGVSEQVLALVLVLALAGLVLVSVPAELRHRQPGKMEGHRQCRIC